MVPRRYFRIQVLHAVNPQLKGQEIGAWVLLLSFAQQISQLMLESMLPRSGDKADQFFLLRDYVDNISIYVIERYFVFINKFNLNTKEIKEIHINYICHLEMK